MIRPVRLTDAEAIADIYNEYVVNTDISFEVEPVGEQEMYHRIQIFCLLVILILFMKKMVWLLAIAMPISGKSGRLMGIAQRQRCIVLPIIFKKV